MIKIIAQADDLSAININTDSTFSLLLEAQNRGHEIFYYLPSSLSLLKGAEEKKIVTAYLHKIKLQNQVEGHLQIVDSSFFDLSGADIILFRQDPPFDIAYITSSYLLEKIQDRVLIVNNPLEIRNCPEKISVIDFAEFLPPTLITSNLEQLKSFRDKYQDIVIKPLYESGGQGVVRVAKQDKSLAALFDMMLALYKAPFIAQKYLPEIKKGDKRVLMLDGEPIGAVTRLPASEDLRANFHAGGTAAKAELSARDLEICGRVGVELKKRNLLFVGLDIIGDYLTEINVTSPTGIHEINRLNNTKIEKLVLDCLEKKLALKKAQ